MKTMYYSLSKVLTVTLLKSCICLYLLYNSSFSETAFVADSRNSCIIWCRLLMSDVIADSSISLQNSFLRTVKNCVKNVIFLIQIFRNLCKKKTKISIQMINFPSKLQFKISLQKQSFLYGCPHPLAITLTLPIAVLQDLPHR